MENYRIDYLPNHKDFKVCQKEGMYHFNTDTALLGEFIKINKDETVLDVGTNNGALLLYIINLGGKASGIEINNEALKLAYETLKINGLKANLINKDFTNYQSDLYDVIISNPPYFASSESEKNNNLNLANARHEGNLTLASLFKGVVNNLKESGRFYLVYRYDRFNEVKKIALENKLILNDYKLVYNSKKKDPITILMEFSFKGEENKLADLHIL